MSEETEESPLDLSPDPDPTPETAPPEATGTATPPPAEDPAAEVEDEDEPVSLSDAMRAYCDEIAAQCAKKELAQGEVRPSLAARVLALQLEATQWKQDETVQITKSRSFKSYSIQLIERNLAINLWKYRMTLNNSMTSAPRPVAFGMTDVFEDDGGAKKGTVLKIDQAHCLMNFALRSEQTDENMNWTWFGEGRDLGIAGSYAVKYGIMRGLLHLGDGSDPDKVQLGSFDNEPRANSSTSQTRSTRVNQTQQTQTTSSEKKSDNKYVDVLIKLADPNLNIPGWFPVKVEGLYKGAIAKGESPEEAFKLLYSKIEEAHIKKCGPDCQHIKAAREAIA